MKREWERLRSRRGFTVRGSQFTGHGSRLGSMCGGALDGAYGTHGTNGTQAGFPRSRWPTVNGEPLRRVKAAVDWESQAVQHSGGIAEQKTDYTGDVFAFGKSA